MFNRYKIVKHWNTPTEFSIRLYTRIVPLLPFWEYTSKHDSVESAEHAINNKITRRMERKVYLNSIPKPTVEKRL